MIFKRKNFLIATKNKTSYSPFVDDCDEFIWIAIWRVNSFFFQSTVRGSNPVIQNTIVSSFCLSEKWTKIQPGDLLCCFAFSVLAGCAFQEVSFSSILVFLTIVEFFSFSGKNISCKFIFVQRWDPQTHAQHEHKQARMS